MKIGLITYHSAYNFGSVLQAYAMQEYLKSEIGNCEIINYRTKEQRRVYAIFVWNQGVVGWLKSLIKNVLNIPCYKRRKIRQENYEKLIKNWFNLSVECVEPEDVYALWDKYDIIISGSDQIWNKMSNELANVSWKYMMPYLLYGYMGKKVSYASSIGNMSDEDLLKIIPEVEKFSAVSIREKETATKLRNLCKVEIQSVVDPTFLLFKEEWIKRFELQKTNERYILYYALNRMMDIRMAKKIIESYAKLHGYKVKMIAPLAYAKSNEIIEVLEETDPVSFLQLIYDADSIITDSYHGTILSINLEKDIYSICGRNVSDFRKTDIMKQIGLDDRIVFNLNDLINKKYTSIDYDRVNTKLNALRVQSKQYLKKALQE